MAAGKLAGHQFTLVVSVFTIIFLVLYAIYGRYSAETQPVAIHDFTNVSRNAPLLHDTHAFILIGFGFLVTFLRRYGFSAIAINLLLVAFVLEWALLIRGFLSIEFSEYSFFSISIRDIAKADYTATAVLVSYGALVGKLSPIQYLMLAAIETPISILNEYLVVTKLGLGDIGGSIVVHFFGAIFGVIASRIVYKQQWTLSEHQGSIYHSDIFSFIGTVFLWAFWPSFNSIFTVTAAEQQRAVLNTFLALIASTVTTFLTSQLVHKDRRFNIKHIASASLAGGVASGVVATLILVPAAALLLGAVAGIASVLSFQYLTPFLAKKFNIHDTRGVLSLHAIPAVVGLIASVIVLFVNDLKVYGETIRNIYILHRSDKYVEGRTPAEQALYQLAGLAVTFVIAAVTGAITGILLKLKIWRQVRDKEYFADADIFDVPEDYDFTTRVTSHIERVELTEHVEKRQLLNNDPIVPTTVTTTA
ncbi:Ammonium transporter Rh type A [Aphelenchoides besseyi]|nr:Ammonium transporter Rh type A [Aphelenchoides besseyi]KAI6237835.1 Ammonium transporter Rh type A [Aphelenchoides besseyi]